MNIIKHEEYFDPIKVSGDIHIVGCGAIGSTVAENLVRLGVNNIHLHDFDTVSEHNIANQMFKATDIGVPKVRALFNMLKEINPDAEIFIHEEPWEGEALSGYIFLAVDDITVRQSFVKKSEFNKNVIAVFDFRMGLSNAQHYAADWSSKEERRILYGTMDFTKEEAEEATPVSACGTSLSILPTVRIIVALGVANFINFVKGESLSPMILMDAFSFFTDAAKPIKKESAQ